jgi:glycosyltransferase involved in cell wall biosynthesis
MPEFRVLHIVPRLFGAGDGVLGGAERYALELARNMANQVSTTLVSFSDREERHETVGQLRIHVIGHPWCVRGQSSNPISLRLWQDLRQANVVHCHQQHILASSFAAAACRLSGRKVFVSDLGGGGWDVSSYISTDRWYHGHLHISEYSRAVYGHAQQPWAHVILGGVDTERFSPAPGVTRKPRVLFTGRLMPHKGINDLVQGLPPGLELELIGQPYDRRFVADLKEMAAGKPVSFRHDCGDDALLEAYRSALCVVLPSVYRTMYGDESKVPELLGQTLLEGMACGAPGICTNVASMPEVVEDGVTGFIVPPNDPDTLRQKLTWLAEHPEQARAMGEASRDRVLKLFTWPAVVSRCLRIYQAAEN